VERGVFFFFATCIYVLPGIIYDNIVFIIINIIREDIILFMCVVIN